MNGLFHVSASPHVRARVTTSSLMHDVVIALTPAALFGIYRFGPYSALILILSMCSAVLSEAAYEWITNQKLTITDGSALVTGLLLGMNLPPTVPLWVPVFGSMFAIIFVKQIFGGLGQNFMNPVLGARAFLLISFAEIMGNYNIDGVSGATPLAVLKEGGKIDLPAAFLGYTGGTIGEVSALLLIVGGIYLLVKKVISWRIPVTYILVFVIFEGLFAGHGFDPVFLASEVCTGGLLLGAIFMATDYVTAPITRGGQFIYAAIIGILTGVFRTFGASAEGVSYAIIITDLFVPLIERVTVPKAFGMSKNALAGKSDGQQLTLKSYKPALVLVAITGVAGLLLGTAYTLTKGPIEEAQLKAQAAAYAAVAPDAASFDKAEDLDAVTASLTAEDGTVADGKYGNIVYDSNYSALDASGNVIGYVVNVTSKDGFGGDISLSLGITKDGRITGLQYLSISETVGLGMKATKPEFYEQYYGKDVDEFTTVKSAPAADNEIAAVSGASHTTGAVNNAVNAALYAVSQLQG